MVKHLNCEANASISSDSGGKFYFFYSKSLQLFSQGNYVYYHAVWAVQMHSVICVVFSHIKSLSRMPSLKITTRIGELFFTKAYQTVVINTASCLGYTIN